MGKTIRITVDVDSKLYKLAEEYCELMNRRPKNANDWTVQEAIMLAALLRLEERVKTMREYYSTVTGNYENRRRGNEA